MKQLKTQHKFFQEVVERCNEKLQSDPGNIEFLRLRGIAHNIVELYDEAIQDLSKVLDTTDTDEPSFFFRGDSYMNSGHHDLAKRDYINGVKLQNPDDAEVLKGYTPQVLSEVTITTQEELENIKKLLEYEKARILDSYFSSAGNTSNG